MSRIVNQHFHRLEQSSVSSASLEVSALLQGFSEQATRGESVAAMLGASLAYRATKVLAMSLLRPLSGYAQILSRTASTFLGFTAEVVSYESLHRSFSSQSFSWNAPGGFAEGLRDSFFNLGFLKVFGHLAKGQHFLIRRTAQDLGMVLGNDLCAKISASQAPSGSYFKRLIEAEAMSFSLEAGMMLVHGFLGHRLQHWESRLERSSYSRAPATEMRRSLPAFAADGGSVSISPHLRNRVFVMDSLAKIDSPTFRSGITETRLRAYRNTLVEMRDFQTPFLEGRRRLMEILREDWIDKCEAAGGHVQRIRLADYLNLLRRANHPVPEWMDAFVGESEANASLQVIALTRCDKRRMSSEEASRHMDREEYLGFNFGASTDLKMIVQPLGLVEASLREFIIDASQSSPVLNVRRYYLPEALIFASGKRAHAHPAAQLHSYVEICAGDELAQSRSEDAWVLQLTPEENVEFHNSSFHPYIALIHDLHIHWNHLNTFPPALRQQQYRAYMRLNSLPIHERRLWISDNDLGQVLEGVRPHSIADEIFSQYLPMD